MVARPIWEGLICAGVAEMCANSVPVLCQSATDVLFSLCTCNIEAVAPLSSVTFINRMCDLTVQTVITPEASFMTDPTSTQIATTECLFTYKSAYSSVSVCE